MKARFGAGARLAFNVIAVVHLGLVFEAGLWAFAGQPRFDLGGGPTLALSALAVAGWIGLFGVLWTYDLGRFSGLAQIRAARSGAVIDDDEALITSGVHAYVRHPLYTAAFLILWAGAWNQLGLATAVWGSLYLLVGSRFEERRLQRVHGEAYAAYRDRVPAFLPWRGRAI